MNCEAFMNTIKKTNMNVSKSFFQMRIPTIAPCFIILLFMACSASRISSQSSPYKKLFFRRDGGGSKAFYISLDSAKKELNLQVTLYNFRDTSYAFSRPAADSTVNLVAGILAGRINITGELKKPAGLTGTWAHIFAVKQSGKQDEITNQDVRDRLMVLESNFK